MSFLTRSLPRAAIAARSITTSAAVRKSAAENIKETVKKVDKTVSSKLVGGIEATESAAGKLKDAAGMSSGEAKGKASELAGEAKAKTAEVEGKAAELKGEAKGKASEVAGKL